MKGTTMRKDMDRRIEGAGASQRIRSLYTSRAFLALLLTLPVAVAGACASSPPICQSVRTQVTPDITHTQLRSAPGSHIGQMVSLKGEIVHTSNTTQGSVILMHEERPGSEHPTGLSGLDGGKYIILESSALDPDTYRPGRLLVVAGQVVGTRVERIREKEYSYPIIQAKEMYLCSAEAPRGYFSSYPASGPLLGPGVGGTQPFGIIR